MGCFRKVGLFSAKASVANHFKAPLQILHIPLLQRNEIESIVHGIQLTQQCVALRPQALCGVPVVVGGDELIDAGPHSLHSGCEAGGDVEPLKVALVARFTVGNLTWGQDSRLSQFRDRFVS